MTTFLVVIVLLAVGAVLSGALARSSALADEQAEASAAKVFDQQRCRCGARLIMHEVDRGTCDGCATRLRIPPQRREGRWTTS
jgi:hypothetical protein